MKNSLLERRKPRVTGARRASGTALSLRARQWRILVVGCGSIGRRHIRNLLSLGQRTLHLVEMDHVRLQQGTQEFGVPGTRTLEESWAWRPEVVIVANPTSWHVETATAAAAQGCHLLIEKPLSDRLEGVEALLRMVGEKQLIALVGCNLRFHPGPALIHHWLTQSECGKILSARFEAGSYLPSWRPGTDFRVSYSAQAALGGGCVLDDIHELDLACWLFGMPREVVAITQDGSALEWAADGRFVLVGRLALDDLRRVAASVPPAPASGRGPGTR